MQMVWEVPHLVSINANCEKSKERNKKGKKREATLYYLEEFNMGISIPWSSLLCIYPKHDFSAAKKANTDISKQ